MLQWSYRAVCATTRVAPGASVPSRVNSRRFASIMQAASTSPAASARAASCSPPMWSPCRPTPTSNRRTSTSTPSARKWDSGINVACGLSTAPVATTRPFRSSALWIGESARTATTDVRSRSVSRIVSARTCLPAAAARRSARTHASGEFHAAEMRPATRSVTCRS
jgi:hypothetical protein